MTRRLLALEQGRAISLFAPASGADQRPMPHHSVILGVDDSLDSLLHWSELEGQILSRGGSVSVDLSAVRNSEGLLSRGGAASGPVSFMRAVEAWGSVITAHRPGRARLRTVCLQANHPDIWQFISARYRQVEVARELRRARLVGPGDSSLIEDPPIGNGHHFVKCDDALMRSAEKGEAVALLSRPSGDVVARVDAHDLLATSARAALASGEPGWFFVDNHCRSMRLARTSIHDTCGASGAHIEAAPSMRVMMGLDLALFGDLSHSESDREALRYAIADAVVGCDRLVDAVVSSLPQEVSLGAGRRGLALMPVNAGIRSPGAMDRLGSLAFVTATALLQSAKLAHELGPYRGYESDRERTACWIRSLVESLEGLDTPSSTASSNSLVREVERTLERAEAAVADFGLRNGDLTAGSRAWSYNLASYADAAHSSPTEAAELDVAYTGSVESGTEVSSSASTQFAVTKVLAAWRAGVSSFVLSRADGPLL